MHAGVVSCSPDAPLAEVARIMGDHRVHVVAVADIGHGRPWGTWHLVSHTDVVAAIASGKEPTARQIAGAEANTVSADDPLEVAAKAMTDHRVAHLVVLDPTAAYPVGIISTLDVASAYGARQSWEAPKSTE
jgi:CBS domain-containing protein